MNKNLRLINLNWRALGAELAELTSEEQGEFFRGFTDEMNSYSTAYAKGMQLSSISSELTKEQREVLSYIGGDCESI